MKKITAFFLSALAMILFVQCGNSSVDQLVSDSNSRGNIISELMNNPAYMNQVMASFMQSMPAQYDVEQNYGYV